MKAKLLALLLLAGGSVFAAPRVAVGVGIGVGPAYGYYAAPTPPPPPVYVAPAPAPIYPAVGVGFGWGPGYWDMRPTVGLRRARMPARRTQDIFAGSLKR